MYNKLCTCFTCNIFNVVYYYYYYSTFRDLRKYPFTNQTVAKLTIAHKSPITSSTAWCIFDVMLNILS